jgi:protein-S-isoprenylcysteine O-methyltransferase Ste14
MKIDVRDIVIGHFGTLTNARTGRTSFEDIATFYIFPGLVAMLAGFHKERFPENFYSVAISVFAIFAALLFSVQIALFSILQRDMSANSEVSKAKSKGGLSDRLNQRRELIREVNANISYLILVACLGVVMLLGFTLTPRLAIARSIASTYLVCHFVLTVLLVIARVHTLFDEEYRRK